MGVVCINRLMGGHGIQCAWLRFGADHFAYVTPAPAELVLLEQQQQSYERLIADLQARAEECAQKQQAMAHRMEHVHLQLKLMYTQMSTLHQDLTQDETSCVRPAPYLCPCLLVPHPLPLRARLSQCNALPVPLCTRTTHSKCRAAGSHAQPFEADMHMFFWLRICPARFPGIRAMTRVVIGVQPT